MRDRLLPAVAGSACCGWSCLARAIDAGRIQRCYLEPGAVVFFYPKYELAAGVREVVSVDLPLERLKPQMTGR